MINWITHIWTKPLAGWTLLDAFGLVIVLTALYVVGMTIYVICADFSIPRIRPDRFRNADEKIATERKRLGYD